MHSTNRSTSRSFTRRYNHIAGVISTTVFIYPAFQVEEVKALPLGKKYWAIWDTAATSTVITPRVIDDLNLPAKGSVKVNTSGGPIRSALYQIALVLVSRVGVSDLKVTEAPLVKGADVLIGMDIITLGDFALSNAGGKTTFSFRSPSLHEIDFNK